jgi:hypothetical protein
MAMLLGGVFVLAAAVALSPGADGWGQDGRWRLPPCAFKLLTGWLLGRPLPCATCGFTHAFSYAAHGRIADAFHEQPAGTLAFFAMLGAMVRAARKLMRGADGTAAGSGEPPRARRHRRRWIIGVTVVAVLIASWAYKLDQALR